MNNYIIITIRALIAFMWVPLPVYAGVLFATGSNDSPLAVPLDLLVAIMVFSTLAGATTLSMRIVRELKLNAEDGSSTKALAHPWWGALSHMLGSWLASSFFFFLCMAQQAGVWTLLATVLIAAFSGAKALEKVSDNFLLARLPGSPKE